MTRPSTEAEYLARMVPPSVRGSRPPDPAARRPRRRRPARSRRPRRVQLQLEQRRRPGTGAVTGTVTVGSNQSDAVPKAAVQSYMDAFVKANPGTTVKINTVDHNSFQENINNYLQGTPDDVFTWFAGYRMQFFAEKGLAGDISDVWKNISGMSATP